MSDLKVEATEPDPSATSLPNDQTVKTEAVEASEPVVKDTAVEDTKPSNGEAVVKEEATEKKGENGADSKKDARRYDENGVLKTSAKQDWDNHRNNSKYDPSILPQTDDPSKIRAQVEFYFSDANLPTDEYLNDLTRGPENLPVAISKICNFGRMKRFQPQSAVVAALRESKFLVVSGPEGMEEVKRAVAYDPTTPKSRAESRSIYAKGFGDEEPGSQFDIEAFFAPYGPTNSVRLRRTDQKLFKGSVFVEFQDEETAKKFLELDPKPLWKGNTLLIKSKRTYMDDKEEEIKSGKIEPMEQRSYRGRGRGRGRGGDRGGDRRGGDRRGDRREARGDRDPDDWKKRREDDRASGFRDNRKDNRGRGRDNNRGGRGNRRNDRGNDRNREREDKEKAESKDVKSEDTSVKTEEPSDKKRPREEENVAEDSAAKKVDTKPNEPTANGNKRTREEDASENKPAKKVDTKSDS
ncbi:hypothetical protein BKA65DRAFT_154036 [Rhexocercosporidium sp. MPI-PUGE-AT-0058]|nr:hypothetical protein BKA65DRAFT_154036 [Rhexocercosporidium sp. MPI-PUGE-AT-0058]